MMPTVVAAHQPGCIQVGPRGPLRTKWGGFGAMGLEIYEEWLEERLALDDTVVWKALGNIGPDDVLFCPCEREHCHAHVIAKVWQREFGQKELFGCEDL